MPIRNFDRYYDPPDIPEWDTCKRCNEKVCADDMEEINGEWYCQECADIIETEEE